MPGTIVFGWSFYWSYCMKRIIVDGNHSALCCSVSLSDVSIYEMKVRAKVKVKAERRWFGASVANKAGV